MTERLPVFVYGTLRVGGRFHDDFLAGRFERRRLASLAGAVMWDNDGFYPFVALSPDEDDVIHGELFDLDRERSDEVMAGLDHLEGHVPGRRGNLYERCVVQIDLAGEEEVGRVQAWIYTNPASSIPDLDATFGRVPSGDWFDIPGAQSKRGGWFGRDLMA